MSAGSFNMEKDTIRQLTYEQILDIINRLPLKYKEVLILKFIETKIIRK